jgi:hypothetical protein
MTIFFSGEYEIDLVDLAAMRQGRYESINDYILRFWDMRNQYFHIHVADKKLARLSLMGCVHT